MNNGALFGCGEKGISGALRKRYSLGVEALQGADRILWMVCGLFEGRAHWRRGFWGSLGERILSEIIFEDRKTYEEVVLYGMEVAF